MSHVNKKIEGLPCVFVTNKGAELVGEAPILELMRMAIENGYKEAFVRLGLHIAHF